MIDYVDDFIQEIKERKPSATATITVNGHPIEKVVSNGDRIDIIVAEDCVDNHSIIDDLEDELDDIELSVSNLKEKLDELRKT